MHGATGRAETTVLLKNVLFATDFSPQSALALKYALPIARRYDATLHAVHVRPDPSGLPASAREGLHALGMQRNTDLAHLKDDLQKLQAQLVPFRSDILTPRGEVWTEVSKIIAEREIDLVVTGTHGRSGVGKLLMGSVAEKIFREASCPVLTVGPAVSGEPDSIVDLHEILFATDLTPTSLAGLPYAISLARENNARLYVLHVVQDVFAKTDERALRERLSALLPDESSSHSSPRIFIEYGAPAERILSLIEELAVDLVVLGVKHKPLHFEASAHLPLATAYKVIRQAVCPVLTVRG